MTSNTFLRLRLKHERNWLEQYYNRENFPRRWMQGMPVFERKITTSRNGVYRLRIVVGQHYPDQLPELFVCDSPKPMPKSPEWEGTHTTHTWPRKYGMLQICFYHPLCWTRDNKLYQVFEKGKQWLEAYEEHLDTGKAMNEILKPMELTKRNF